MEEIRVKVTAETLPEWAEGALILEGFDQAIIGLGQQRGSQPCLIYSVEKIIANLKNDMDSDDAWEFYEHNIGCMYAGPGTPIMMEAFNGVG